MAVYHPHTDAGVVHYASRMDLPAKKIWSWGVDARGLSWREALSDNNSAYVEIQAGLFRDQETYGFLEPQESVSFSEYWMPVREIGGVSYANPEAVMHITREEGTSSLNVGMNISQALPGAQLVVLENGQVVESRNVSLEPSSTFTAEYPDLTSDVPYTVELRNGAGDLVIAHTEGKYDFTPASEIKTGPQQAYEYPSPEERSEGDWISLGEEMERNGKRLEALKHYREGVRRYPESLVLKKAAGRLGVDLKQYDAAAEDLKSTLHRVSNDYEAFYYLGHALSATGDEHGALSNWEQSQSYGTFRPASLFGLASLEARQGDWQHALEWIEKAVAETPSAVRLGGLEVSLLRKLDRIGEAQARLDHWQRVDPTSSFLRYESILLGSTAEGDTLWYHLAGDPERILEIAVDYMRFGLWDDALAVLERDYPKGPGVFGEPGAPSPGEYPLIAYYRGFCREALEQSGAEDFDAASRMSTRYVFPNRAESLAVLQAALAHNANDATALFLLGSLCLSGGMADEAMEAWEKARDLDPDLPVLHRNMGYTVLHAGGPPAKAVELFMEGLSVDSTNAGLYFGLDEAMRRDGRSAGERADVLLKYPELQDMPADLVFQLARTLSEAGRFDEANALFFGRFFPREEGGTNVREVYLEVKIAEAESFARGGRCGDALQIIDGLGNEVEELAFTSERMQEFMESPSLTPRIEAVRRRCGG
jgi:tetratricopeptide (TPR) repeat protein